MLRGVPTISLKSIFTIELLLFLARLALGGLLIGAGALKAGHAVELASAIAGFRILPPPTVPSLAAALPYAEILLGLYLVAGLFTRIVAWVAAAQFLLYAAAVASAVLRGIPANCGCFGPNDVAVADWPHVAFDVALALVASLVATRSPGRFALDRRFRNP